MTKAPCSVEGCDRTEYGKGARLLQEVEAA